MRLSKTGFLGSPTGTPDVGANGARPSGTASSTPSPYSKQALAKTLGMPRATPSAASGLDPIETRLVQYIDQDASASLARLKQAVETNSGTFNIAGVNAIADMYEPRLKKLGFATRRADMGEVGRASHLIASLAGGQGPRFLLIGHLDTIFEKDSGFLHWEELPNGMVRGPGVADMKGGNEALISALEALHDAGLLARMNITVVFSADEETPGVDKDETLTTTRRDLIEAAKQADVALCFEMARYSINLLKPAKRGSSTWQIEAMAKSGHSSVVFSENVGPGAIYPLSRMLGRFSGELRGNRSVTVNVGVVAGGARVEGSSGSATAHGKDNVIPAKSNALGDLRFLSDDELQATRATMKSIVDDEIAKARENLTPEAAKALQANIKFRDRYPGMPATKANLALLAKLSQVSEDLGVGKVEALDPNLAGAADISFAAPYTPALLDGLGPFGDGPHSIQEVLDPKTMPIAAKRAALLLYRMAR